MIMAYQKQMQTGVLSHITGLLKLALVLASDDFTPAERKLTTCCLRGGFFISNNNSNEIFDLRNVLRP